MDTYYKKQLAFKNVIIQLVSESNIDHNGYQTMKLGNTSGKGIITAMANGFLLRGNVWKQRMKWRTMMSPVMC